jgi:hypothetical protein
MGKVYKDQTFLTVTLTTKQDIAQAQQTLIKYRKPSGATGQFNATVTDPAKGVLTYKFTEGQLNETGQWTFWAYVVFDTGDCAAGEPSGLMVYEEGC